MRRAAQPILSVVGRALPRAAAGRFIFSQSLFALTLLIVPRLMLAQARVADSPGAGQSADTTARSRNSGFRLETELLSEAAKQALDSQHWQDAAAALEKLAKLAPSVAEVHSNLGLAYYFEGRPSEALASFERAIKLKSGIAQARVMSGICQSELGRSAESVAILAPAFRKTSGTEIDHLIGLHLQKAYTELKQYEKAAAVSEELLRRYPKDEEVLFHVSQLYADRSYELMSNLMRSDPDSVWAHFANAQVQESLARYDVARTEYKKVLERQPAMPGVHYRLGRVILLGSSRTPEVLEEASRAFEEELAIGSYNPDSEYELGEINREQGKYDLALGHFSSAVAQRPDFVEARIGLARTLMRLARTAEAVSPLKEAARLDPENRVPHALLANAYRALGDTAAAQAEAKAYSALNQTEKRTGVTVVGAPTAQQVDP